MLILKMEVSRSILEGAQGNKKGIRESWPYKNILEKSILLY